MVHMNDPVAAAKLFSELDHTEDPFGRAALKSVDFRGLGLFFPAKQYTSTADAAQSLLQNKKRMNAMLDSVKEKQIKNFKHTVGAAVDTDCNTARMPTIRVNVAKSSQHSRRVNPEFTSPDTRRITVAKYLSTARKETNLHQSDICATSVTTGIFQAASAHHPFNKAHQQIKKIHTSIFGAERRKNSRYVPADLPVAVTNGAEHVAESMRVVQQSLVSNTPFNVQQQRNLHLDNVQSTRNSAHVQRLH